MGLKEAVKQEIGSEVVLEESPGYDSKANGEVERAVQMVQGQFRAMKDALETRSGVRVNGEHCCIPWLVAHASDTITRFHVYEDGKTGYNKLRTHAAPMQTFMRGVKQELHRLKHEKLPLYAQLLQLQLLQSVDLMLKAVQE